MATIIDALIVTFAPDGSGFKKGAEEVEKASSRTRDQAKKTFDQVEDGGKKTAQAFRGVTTQVLGMFLAFQGASSLTGFLSNMLATTAAADRLGSTLGLSAGKVIAWRQAMKEVGGQPGDADSALKNIEGLKQDWLHGGLLSDPRSALLSSFGITQKDLKDSAPDDILQKLAGAKRPYGDQEYANRLQQLGMSDNMTYFLMQGGDKVGKQIAAYEKNTKAYEDQAKQAEQLQKNMADLNNNIMASLVPALNQLLPPLVTIAGKLAEWTGKLAPSPGHVWGIPGIGELRRDPKAQSPIGSGAPVTTGNDPIYAYFKSKGLTNERALGITAGIHAESNGNPNAENPTSHAFGIGQWLGPRKKALFKRYGPKPNLSQQLEFLWSELNGGDRGGKSVLGAQNSALETLIAYVSNFMRPGFVGSAKDMARGSAYLFKHRGSAAGIINIHVDARGNQNAQAVGRAVHHAVTKASVQMADRTVKQ